MLQHGICVSAVGSGFRGTSWEMPNSVASSGIPGPCLSLLSFHFTAQKHAPVFLQYTTPRQSLSTLQPPSEKRKGKLGAAAQCFSSLLSDFTASANTSPLPNRWNCFSIRDLWCPLFWLYKKSGLNNIRWHVSTKSRKSMSQTTLDVSFINKLQTSLNRSPSMSVVKVCLHYCFMLMSAKIASLKMDALFPSVCAI